MKGARILVVDDEPAVRQTLKRALEAHGYDVRSAANGADAVTSLRWGPDVVLLDLMLPDLDGVEVMRRIRGQSEVPIVILSARGEEAQKVRALDQGADDYVTKPVGTDELLARIRVAMRHAARQTAGTVFEVGDLRIDFDRRHITRGGQPVHLTPTEYKVLRVLVHRSGEVITHRMMLREGWGPEYETETQYLHVFMHQLRRKLEPQPDRPRYILTEPGVGYRFWSTP
jgi:two-component system KDP operon response regulator KdpE